MKNIDLQWKEFNISASKLKEQVDILAPDKCLGISANSTLQLHMSEDMTQEEQEAIIAHYEAITAESVEASSYKSREVEAEEQTLKESLIKAAKLAMVSKTWATMTVVEKKLAIGLDSEVSLEDLQG